MKTVNAVYVSLPKTLQTVLQVPGLFNKMQEYVNKLSSDKQFLSNFVQGDLWLKKYKNISQNQIVFRLFIYLDEFEVGNPLGIHAGEQKLGGVYASLACLPPHLANKLENVFLSTICHSKYVNQFGNEKIFAKTLMT